MRDVDDDSELGYDEPRAFGWRGLLLLVSAIPAMALAVAALAGIGLLRHLPSFSALAGGLALVLLPIVGLSALASVRRRSLVAIGSSAWFWSLAILFGVPFYFPGERGEAARAGVRLLAQPLEEAPRSSVVGIADWFVGLLGSEPERLPEAVAVQLEELEEPPRGAAAGSSPAPRPLRAHRTDEVVLPYDGDGQIMRVPVFFDGPRYGDEFPLIFDTGATYTTLNREALDLLEIEVPPSAPVAVLRTANGEIEAPLVLVDAVWLGDAVVEWVTIAVCDPCASDGVFGLLGLNVSGQFQLALDHEEHEIRLKERDGENDRRLDVVQWAVLSSRIRRWRDGRTEVEVALRNRAQIGISEAAALIECPGGRFEVLLEAVPPQGVGSSRMTLPQHTECGEYRLELAHAQWELDRF